MQLDLLVEAQRYQLDVFPCHSCGGCANSITHADGERLNLPEVRRPLWPDIARSLQDYPPMPILWTALNYQNSCRFSDSEGAQRYRRLKKHIQGAVTLLDAKSAEQPLVTTNLILAEVGERIIAQMGLPAAS